ncbi:hypothetical protein K2X83_01290 [Patescibacteria group bacterium]|nr:hypothetical protein [Patescibacteria group bacterium]
MYQRTQAKILRLIGLFFISLFPFAAFAGEPTLFSVLCTVVSLVDLATPIVVALALLGFFWGLAMYIFTLGSGGEDKDKKKGREIMTYGVIVFFVMLSIWGIVNMLQETFGVSSGVITPPTFQGVPPPQFAPTPSC